MTVIVWDGKTLAADKLSFGHSINTITKVRKINGMLVGCSGKTMYNNDIFAWAEGGFVKESMPESQKDFDKSGAQVIVINQDKQILIYETSHIPWVSEAGFHALGSGADFALGAVLAGADAREAVRITSKLCISVGNGVNSISLDSDDVFTELVQ